MATAPERQKETCRFASAASAFAVFRRPLLASPLAKQKVSRRAEGRRHKEFFYIKIMVEPLLSGIVLGLVPITIIGLFVTAYLQYKRGDRLL